LPNSIARQGSLVERRKSSASASFASQAEVDAAMSSSALWPIATIVKTMAKVGDDETHTAVDYLVRSVRKEVNVESLPTDDI